METTAQEGSSPTNSDHIYQQHAYYSNPIDLDAPTDAQAVGLRRQLIEETTRTIPELYEKGVPFFTKEAVADIVTQIDSSRDSNGVITYGRQILLPRVDGGTQAVKLETGRVLSSKDWPFPLPQGLQQVIGEPVVEYCTYQQLSQHRHDDEELFRPEFAYVSMRLRYHLLRRKESAGLLIPWTDPEPMPKLSAYFDKILAHWETSQPCHQLSLLGAKIPQITKIIAFGCGNMSSEDEFDTHSASQHALILSLRRLLQGRTTSPIECIAQDPIYASSNKGVLAEHDIRVVEDPRGFLHVDNSSAVLTFAPNIPVRQVVTDIARPALLVWDRVRSEEENRLHWKQKGWDYPDFTTDAESPRLRSMMLDEYDEVMQLPKDGFNGAVVYARKI